MYYVPLGREMCLWMGGVDASRSTGEKVLKEGNSIIVYPGGVPEIFRTDPDSKEVRCVPVPLHNGMTDQHLFTLRSFSL